MKIKTGLASYGLSGSVFHAPFISTNSNFELYKIVERSKRLSAERYPEAVIVNSFDELIADKDIELVVINTPDATHYPFVKQALMASKHVVVEKPFVYYLHEAEELAALAKERGLLLSVFQNRRWDGDFLTIKKLLKENKLGRLVEFESNWQRFRTFIRADAWREEAVKRSGIVNDLGSHMIDQALVLFGMPHAVEADIDKLREGSLVDDYYDICLIYPDKKVRVKATCIAREQTPRYVLHGTNGSFLKYGIDPQEDTLKAGLLPIGDDWGKEPETEWGTLNAEIDGLHYQGKIETLAGNYAAFYQNVFERIRQNAEPAVPINETLNLIKVIEAAFESNEQKKIVYL